LSLPQRPIKKKTGLLIAAIIGGIVILLSCALIVILSMRPAQNPDTMRGSGSVTATVSPNNGNGASTDAQMSGAESVPDAPATEPATEPAPEPEPDVFPISFTAFGNNYSITGYEIGVADNGTTTLTLLGNGYSILPMRNGQIRIPVWASFYSSGVENDSTGCSTSSNSVVYSFSVSSQPETIVFKNGETNEIIVSFDTGSGPSVSSPFQTPDPQPDVYVPGSLAFHPASNPNEHGNSGANILCGGIAVEKGGWVYYAERDSLYRIRTDGTQRSLLTQSDHMGIGSINVIGDWIYFLDRNINFENHSSNNVLYRMRTDGTQKARLSDRHCSLIYVIGDWIYFSTYTALELDPEKIMEFGIYIIRTDGTHETMIEYGSYGAVTVEGDWIYFLSDGNLYRMPINGRDITQLTYGTQIAGYLVLGDWVYYSDFVHEYGLFRVRTDGTDMETLNAGPSLFINTDGRYIYFSDFNYMTEDKDYGIYRISPDGSGLTLIHNARAVSVNITGNNIYFRDLDLDGSFRISTNGTGLQRMDQ